MRAITLRRPLGAAPPGPIRGIRHAADAANRRAAKSPDLAPKFPQGLTAAAAEYFYDAGLVSNAPALLIQMKVVPMSQVVFGTDSPAGGMAEHVKALKVCGVVSPEDLKLIDRENALALVPGLGT